MMDRRSCVPTRHSSNGGGLPVGMRKTSADAHRRHVTQSADLPVRPFGAEPAEPAFAAGAPPDASGAAPARTPMAVLTAISLLCTAAPGAASKCFDARHRPQVCQAKSGPVVASAPAKKAAGPMTVVAKSAGGGGFSHWPRIAADLMP
jgi:hypothetical protein